MLPTPRLSPYASLLIEVSSHLVTGVSCLIVCDKGWTMPLAMGVRDRVRGQGGIFEYLDGRPASGETQRNDVGVMLTTIIHLRRVLGTDLPRRVVALPHLDLLCAREAGLNSLSREFVPLLHEVPCALLGFQDPTLPLLPIAEKVFERRYAVAERFRELRDCPVPASDTDTEPNAVTMPTVPEPPGHTPPVD